jgi:hypothetical protein
MTQTRGQPSRDLAKAFKHGTKYKDEHAAYTVKLVDLAPVILPTGKVFAADPFTFHRVEPFDRTVKKGTYPVIASVAKVAPLKKGRTQERVGAAMLRFKKGAPASWINATRKGQKLAKLDPDHYFGFGVDAGTACFCDITAAAALAKLNEVELANDNFEGWLMAKVSKGMLASKQAWGTGSAITVPDTKANVVAFSSGWGDGFYGSYWGLSAKGEPLCLVTDFGVYPVEPRRASGV